MFRKVLMLTAIVLVFAASNLQAEQIPVSWDGGGNYNDWDDANNWDPNIVPDNNATNTYAVTINAGGGDVRVCLQQSRTIDQLDCYGEVELQNYTSDWVELILVDVNGLTNHGYLVIEGLEINGDVTNTAGVMLELEDMGIEGDLYNPAGATIEVIYEVWVGAVENAGTIIVVPFSSLHGDESTLHNTGQINIYGGSYNTEDILDNNDTGLINGFGVLYADQLLRNKGEITAYGGSLAVLIEGPLLNSGLLGNYPLSSLQIKPAVDVNNTGTIQVNSGGGVAFDCNVVNEPNAIVQLLGGTLAATTITQSADANFAGFGTISGNVVIEPNAIIELTGPTNIIGDVNIPAGATLEISDGQTLITGHTTCKGTIHLKGGTVVFQGGCDCDDCNIINEAGIDRNRFDINADGTVDFKDFASFADTWLWQASWY